MSADEAPAEHLHPIALVSGFGKALRNLFGGIAAGGYFAIKGNATTGLLIVAGIVAVSIAGLILHWWRFSYRVGQDAIRIDSGILSRNHRTIPFDRVQDVSIAQPLLHRLIGVAQVTLETGSSTAGKEEGVLEAVSLARAEALRELVRSRRGGAVAAEAGPAAVIAEEPAPLFAMDLKRVLTLGLLSFSLAILAVLFGATQTFGDLFDFDPFSRRFWRMVLTDSGIGPFVLGHRYGVAIGGTIVLLLVGVLTGIVRTVPREWGFTLTRSGRALRRRRGLFTRTDVSLPLRRMQVGVIGTGPVRERLGFHRFAVESLASDPGAGGRGQNDHVLAPLATREELVPIGSEIGWPLPGDATEWRPVDKAHVTSFCVALLPVLPLLILFGPLRWLEWKRTAYALEDGRLLIRTGWWKRRTLLIPLANIQTVDRTENALGRRFGIASLVIGTAGGSASGHRLPSLPRKEASHLHRLLLSHAA